ncbi:MAG TPA: Rv3235 family protein [Nocardioidaceae bacterium]|nr:Rv3235 family protein [Nocardioidaceae bacterium]
MTAHTQPEPTSNPPVRRPPAPPDQWATVTRLDAGRARQPGPVPIAAVQGTLALDLRGCAGMPTTPHLRPRLNVVDGNGRAADEVQAWAARFAQAVVEVLGGDRPLPQLVRWTSKRVYLDLGRRVRILARNAPVQQRLRTVRPQVRSVHVFQPTPDTAEVSVHVRHGQRSRALAARLELTGGRWQCTALQLG